MQQYQKMLILWQAIDEIILGRTYNMLYQL